MHGSGLSHSGHFTDSVQNVREIAGAFAVLAVLRGRREHRHRQDMLRLKTRVHRYEAVKTTQHQARAGKQDERQRYFGNNKHLPQYAFGGGSDPTCLERFIWAELRNL